MTVFSLAAMGRCGAVALTAVLCATAPATAAYAGLEPPPLPALGQSAQQSTVEVGGQGRVKAAPDVVNIALGVEATRPTARDAFAEAAAAAKRVTDALRGAGVAEKDIKTDQILLTTQYVPNNYPQISGYLASASIRATVRQVSSASAVLDAATAAGGDAIRIHGLNFGLDDNREAVRLAREAAYRDAEAKALQYARLSGRRLGKPLEITETSAPSPGPIPGQPLPPPPPPGAPPIDFPVNPGELEVSVSVRVVFALV